MLNRVRLPLYLKNAQFPTEANRFRLSNGTSKTLSVTIKKSYDLQTDYLSDSFHQKIVIALNHDTVNIEGDRYIGGVSVDGEYEIAAVDFLDYPLRQASVKLQVTPFDFTNDNCQTCEEASQLSLVDDDAGALTEGEVAPVDVFANDNICCFPVTAEIVSFASGYLDSATIDATTGIATLTVKNPVNTVGSIILATYRVTCPDGSYDEADIYGSITGSGTECEQPAGGGVDTISAPPPPFTVNMEWITPAVDPGSGYEWQLYDMADPGTPVQTGTSADKTVTLTGLSAGINYGFYVRSVCAEGVYSPYTEYLFTTPGAEAETCGSYTISCDDSTLGSQSHYYSFMDCEGNIVTHGIINLTTKVECMLMDEFNTPIYFVGDGFVTYNYDAPC